MLTSTKWALFRPPKMVVSQSNLGIWAKLGISPDKMMSKLNQRFRDRIWTYRRELEYEMDIVYDLYDWKVVTSLRTWTRISWRGHPDSPCQATCWCITLICQCCCMAVTCCWSSRTTDGWCTKDQLDGARCRLLGAQLRSQVWLMFVRMDYMQT